MNRQDEMHKDTEKWESRELGASETYARRADIDLNALDESLGLKPISIRLQQGIPMHSCREGCHIMKLSRK